MSPLHLQTLRGKLGLTKKQLAFELGVTVETVKLWESGVYRLTRYWINRIDDLVADLCARG